MKNNVTPISNRSSAYCSYPKVPYYLRVCPPPHLYFSRERRRPPLGNLVNTQIVNAGEQKCAFTIVHV